MIKLQNYEVIGWEHAIRGMRNPMNSWDKSDSSYKFESQHDLSGGCYEIGKNDHELMLKLAKAGAVHGKFRRMITVYADITAPLYWWKEFDTYKVGTVANSCSTMHKIHEKEFEIGDFSCEHLNHETLAVLYFVITHLNKMRNVYVSALEKDKRFWWQMIQLLPSSYNQKRTVMLNYEVLSGIYEYRKDHKLDEWQDLCTWIEGLPHSEIITCRLKEGV